jgi:hypothetical protein
VLGENVFLYELKYVFKNTIIILDVVPYSLEEVYRRFMGNTASIFRIEEESMQETSKKESEIRFHYFCLLLA